MLPVIEILLTGSCEDGGCTAPLRFLINGHPFSFRGLNAAQRYTMERDLEDARKLINAARAAKPRKKHGR